MGGQALKGFPTRRIRTDEYDALSRRVVGELAELFPRCRLGVPRSYASKQDHGDLDVVITREGLGPGWDQAVRRHFRPAAVSTELPPGQCFSTSKHSSYSFEVDRVQVDLVFSSERAFEFALGYFSFNDLGNLMGRIAHRVGLKFGHRGLLLPLRAGSHLFETVIISEDFRRSLEFLGYDPRRWQQGFETREDLFRYTASSRFFHPDIYLLDNRNHKARTRDAKRPTYRAFVRWLEAHAEQLPHHEFGPRRDTPLGRLFAFFPQARERCERALADREQALEYRRRFSGELVRDLTGLRGRELGAFLRAFVAFQGGEEAWREKVLALPAASIARAISEFRRTRETDCAGPAPSPAPPDDVAPGS